MVDFSKFRSQKNQPNIIDPLDIFRRLPKPEGVNDLYTSQAEVLQKWFQRREESDVVIKLHTGGGKTLVGLLIAQSMLNEHKAPVMYLVANRQLADQTLKKSIEYSIPAVVYESGSPLPDDFLSANKPLIATYQALFNGLSVFGIQDSGRKPIRLGGLILDDAHVSFSTIRDAFTLTVSRNETSDDYFHISALFRKDFEEIDKLGLFNDIVENDSFGILEVPYWSWINHLPEIQNYIAPRAHEQHKFQWPLLRNLLRYCTCLISSKALTITTPFPFIDLFPSFETCLHRVFMSATTGDDSGIIQTFDANEESVSKPIVSNSLAGVSERMILIPQLMEFTPDNPFELIKNIIEMTLNEHQAGIVILAPSNIHAQQWQAVATLPNSPDEVGQYIQQLQNGVSKGPFVFANRYDGIDLPGDACRLLIMSQLPKGIDDYDLYQTGIFQDSDLIESTLARRVEQGMGRGARGAGDYCIVILYGRELVSWIGRHSNQQLLTSSTRAQIEIGQQVSKAISSEETFIDVVKRCLNRDKEWIAYHAETLAELTEQETLSSLNLQVIATQRKAFKLARDGYPDKSVSKIQKFIEERGEGEVALNNETKGWLYQAAARLAYSGGLTEQANQLQKKAFAHNRYVIRPRQSDFYERPILPSRQSEAIAAYINKFKIKKALLTDFEKKMSFLNSKSTANQFEQAFAELGVFLGFASERPESIYGTGPDILWLLDGKQGLVIEAKSKKDPKNPLTKDENGQLLDSVEWFKLRYPEYTVLPISVHPNTFATKNVSLGQIKALTLVKLDALLVETRNMLVELCNNFTSEERLVITCEQLLTKSNLTPQKILSVYLQNFQSMT